MTFSWYARASTGRTDGRIAREVDARADFERARAENMVVSCWKGVCESGLGVAVILEPGDDLPLAEAEFKVTLPRSSGSGSSLFSVSAQIF